LLGCKLCYEPVKSLHMLLHPASVAGEVLSRFDIQRCGRKLMDRVLQMMFPKLPYNYRIWVPYLITYDRNSAAL